MQNGLKNSKKPWRMELCTPECSSYSYREKTLSGVYGTEQTHMFCPPVEIETIGDALAWECYMHGDTARC